MFGFGFNLLAFCICDDVEFTFLRLWSNRRNFTLCVTVWIEC